MSRKAPALAILLLVCLLLSLLTGAKPIPTVLTPNEGIDLRFRDAFVDEPASMYNVPANPDVDD